MTKIEKIKELKEIFLIEKSKEIIKDIYNLKSNYTFVFYNSKTQDYKIFRAVYFNNDKNEYESILADKTKKEFFKFRKTVISFGYTKQLQFEKTKFKGFTNYELNHYLKD